MHRFWLSESERDCLQREKVVSLHEKGRVSALVGQSGICGELVEGRDYAHLNRQLFATRTFTSAGGDVESYNLGEFRA